jgi:exosortase
LECCEPPTDRPYQLHPGEQELPQVFLTLSCTSQARRLVLEAAKRVLELIRTKRLHLGDEVRLRSRRILAPASCAGAAFHSPTIGPMQDPAVHESDDPVPMLTSGLPSRIDTLQRDFSAPGSKAGSKHMTGRSVLFTVICVLAVLLFAVPLATLARLSQQEGMYSHTCVIPPICLVLVYFNRKRIFRDVQYGFGLGVVLVASGIMLYWLSQRASLNLDQNDYLFLAVLSFVMVLIGAFALSFGTQAFRAAFFPLSFLFLMLPIPRFLLEGIVLALQRGSAEVADAFFRLSGVPVLRQGFTFSLPSVTIDIADECSGIRSSLALFITSLLAGYVFLQSKWRRAFLSVFAIAMGIVKNGIRIVTLSLLAAYVDRGFLTGSLHHRYGGAVFSPLALAVLVPVLWLLQRQERNVQSCKPRAEHTTSGFVPEAE